MCASGSLIKIDIKEHSFEKIKEIFLSNLLERSSEWGDTNCVNTEYYFLVAQTNSLKELMGLFQTEVCSYCPNDSGIYINGKFYNNWADSQLPMIIDNYLIFYETDQQMTYQNLPFECLSELYGHAIEIWS